MIKSNSLFLVLKAKWFDMIKSGKKKEEYRRVCDHWNRHIWLAKPKLETVRFQMGYCCPTDPDMRKLYRMEFKIEEIDCVYCTQYKEAKEKREERFKRGSLLEAWGYNKYENYFVISLGRRIE